MNILATFFASIVSLFTGMFGGVPDTTISPVLVATTSEQHEVKKEKKLEKAPADSIASTTISSSTVQTYRSDKYGLELRYKSNLSVGGCSSFDLCIIGAPKNSWDERVETALSITVMNNTSLESWYASTTENGYYNKTSSAPRFENTTIGGFPARRILDLRNSFDRGGAPCQVSAVDVKGKIFELCDQLTNDVSKTIIDSIKFYGTTTYESIHAIRTYRSSKYGFEIKYKHPLVEVAHNSDEALSLGLCFTDDNTCIKSLSVYVRENTSLDDWFVSSSKNNSNYATQKFNDVNINGLIARKISDLRSAPERGGHACVITAIYYKGKVFEMCDYQNDYSVRSVIDSFKIH